MDSDQFEMKVDFFDKNYFESGPQTNKSLYQNYRWIPELTIPLAHHIVQALGVSHEDSIMDFGCAKGYLVHAFRLLGISACGVDVSEYAISQASREVEPFVKKISPCSTDFDFCDFLIAKDVLEHIPYEVIDEQLAIIRKKCKSIFSIMPLGQNGKYIIPAYEFDKSHHIRESADWWADRFNQAGFNDLQITTDLGVFKANWSQINPDGNVLIIGR